MDSLPFISILALVFAIVIIGEMMKIKKEVRRLTKLNQHLRKDIEKQKVLQKQDKHLTLKVQMILPYFHIH